MQDSTKPNNANLITLRQTQEQKKFSEGNSADWLLNEITALGEAFGEGLTAERQVIYATALADIPRDQIRRAIRLAINELRFFPKVAELRELAGFSSGVPNDGRPGPEEAWARMPKGERMEDDSIVWCEEERAAYNACRGLLLDGDLIGARMAFKERYEKEVAKAHSLGRSAHWTVSAGYDVENRLTTLAIAVQDQKIGLEHALNFIPEQRQDDFVQMLPPGTGKGLLVGKVEKLPDLPGLPGLLTKMRMQDLVPDELQPNSRPQQMAELSPEEHRKRRKELMAQIEFLRRSRNGSGAIGK
jgi:hypothetical protein